MEITNCWLLIAGLVLMIIYIILTEVDDKTYKKKN